MTRRAGTGRVDIADDAYIQAPPAQVAAAVADPRNHAVWWPHLTLTGLLDRGVKGQRWLVDGQIVGSMEIWVEPYRDGTIVHHYVRGLRDAAAPRDVGLRHVLRWKAAVVRLTDTLERRGCSLRSMADRTESSTSIDAPPGAVLDVIADFDSYPEWAGEVKKVSVLSEDGDGWADQVEFTLDAGAIKDTYVLDYDWDVREDGTGVVSWSLVTAQVLKTMNGSYTLAAQGEGTLLTYRLSVDVKIPMLGMLKRKAEKVIVDTALEELKKRVEA
jgi:carbon monoxide dehydrogenase subunit G